MYYKVGSNKIHGNITQTARMFYRALSYNGMLYNIEVAVTNLPETNDTKGLSLSNTNIISCTRQEPHTEKEFINIAEEEEGHTHLIITASLDKENKKRISVVSLPKHLQKDIDAAAMLNTPNFDPNIMEENIIKNFISFIER